MDRKKILFVDDEEGFLELMKMALENKDEFEIIIETKGVRVVDIALRVRPDLIILDIVLPDIDGYEILRRIRNIDTLRETPVIFLSAYAMRERMIQRDDALAKACPLLSKPVTIEKLVSCIKKNIDKS